MPEFNLSIFNLFERAFGVNRGTQYDAQQVIQPVDSEISFQEPTGISEEGTEFVTTRNQLNAHLPDGRLVFMPIALGGILLPNEPSISFTKTKNIVKTKLVGSKRAGTVKELISDGDWNITIRGIALNFASRKFYPEDQVKAIRDLDARQEALDVECALTSLLGIYRLVIEEISFPEMIGVPHAQAYELKCTSDQEFNLIIED